MIIIKNYIYGLIIGLGFIIPGVSGGVIATILGIYENIIYRLNNLNKNIQDNIYFLLPLFGGIITSIILFSNIILYLLNTKFAYISYVFIGLILGCIPFLTKEIKDKTNQKINYLFVIICFLIGFSLYFIEKININNITNINIFTMLIAGFCYAIGKIVPGISGSALLMLLGLYKYFLEIIAHPLNINLSTILTLLPFLISFIISSIIILKLINYLFNKHFRNTYSAIIGFVISSILFIYPNTFSLSSIIILICSFMISYTISSKEK